MTEVIKFKPEIVGAGYRFDNDEILEAAKGKKFGRLVVIGDLEDGGLYVAGTANAGETMILLELAKSYIVTGKDGRE